MPPEVVAAVQAVVRRRAEHAALEAGLRDLGRAKPLPPRVPLDLDPPCSSDVEAVVQGLQAAHIQTIAAAVQAVVRRRAEHAALEAGLRDLGRAKPLPPRVPLDLDPPCSPDVEAVVQGYFRRVVDDGNSAKRNPDKAASAAQLTAAARRAYKIWNDLALRPALDRAGPGIKKIIESGATYYAKERATAPAPSPAAPMADSAQLTTDRAPSRPLFYALRRGVPTSPAPIPALASASALGAHAGARAASVASHPSTPTTLASAPSPASGPAAHDPLEPCRALAESLAQADQLSDRRRGARHVELAATADKLMQDERTRAALAAGPENLRRLLERLARAHRQQSASSAQPGPPAGTRSARPPPSHGR